MTRPVISIIIPTYNRCNLLGATLDSILNQTYKNWECIIVDDYSEDYTTELMEFYLARDVRFKFFIKPKGFSAGANAARNFGFKKSNGDYINWFDSDDIMHSDFLKLKLKKLRHDSKIICCITTFKTFSIKDGELVFKKQHSLRSRKIFQHLSTNKHPIPTHGPLWRRDYLEKLSLFNEQLTISQDLEFHSRILPDDSKISIINLPLFYLRKGHKNLTSELYSNPLKHFSSFFYVRKQIIESYNKDAIIQRYMQNELMGIFRYLLSLKEYQICLDILRFLRSKERPLNTLKKLRFLKMYTIFNIVRILGRGETRFKKVFRLD